MNSYYLEQLASSIRIKFGTSNSEPTQPQLGRIIQDVDRISYPSKADWLKIVKLHCPSTGNYFYKGLDNSDLNTLLQMAKK